MTAERAEFTTLTRKDAGVPKFDLTGSRFGRLTVVEFIDVDRKRSRWLCRCDCGTEKVLRGGDLKAGKSQSCGCLRREIMSATKRTHGCSSTPEYVAWGNMIDRCKPEHKRSKDYHERGIGISSEWREDFTVFLRDMGEMPRCGMTLERIENDKGYGKGNCSWATKAEQSQNRRPASEWKRTVNYGRRKANHVSI